MTIETAELDAFLAQSLRRERRPSAFAQPDAAGEREVLVRLRFHGIAVLLVQDEAWMAAAPTWLSRIVECEARLIQIWEATHREALVPVLEGLADARIEHLLMKGTALAYSLYPEAAMRPRGDSDLLVRSAALGTARDILRRAGFSRAGHDAPTSHQETWQADGGFGLRHQIDLHWETHPAPALRHLFPPDELFAGKRPLRRLSPHAWAADPAQTFLHCMINQAAHTSNGFFVDGHWMSAGGRLSWSYDIHLLAGSFTDEDWARLVQASLDKHVAPSVLRMLKECRLLLGTKLPDDVQERLAGQPGDCLVARYFDRTRPVRKLLLDIRGSSTLRGKFGQVARQLFPGRETLLKLHPEYPDWPLALLHLRRIAGYVGRSLSRRRGNA